MLYHEFQLLRNTNERITVKSKDTSCQAACIAPNLMDQMLIDRSHGSERYHFKNLNSLPRSARRTVLSLLSICCLPKYGLASQSPRSSEAERHHRLPPQGRPSKQSTGQRIDPHLLALVVYGLGEVRLPPKMPLRVLKMREHIKVVRQPGLRGAVCHTCH